MRAIAYSLPTLGLLGFGLTACFGHHTADEEVLFAENAVEADGGTGTSDSGAKDGGNNCNGPNAIENILCGLGGDDGLNGIIDGLLGGGSGANDCSKQPDIISQGLCALTGSGGSGLEGLLGGLLGGGNTAGGGLLGDAGIEGVISSALSDVISGILDDLISSVLGGGNNRDAGAGGLFGGLGGGNNRDAGAGGLFGGLFGGGDGGAFGGLGRRDAGAPAAGNKSRGGEDSLVRSAEECESADHEDRLTRLLCARQALDALRAAQAAEPTP